LLPNETVITPNLSRPVTQSDTGFGLYFHIPFCVSKCSYCAFSSIAGGGRLIAGYVEALHQEVDRLSYLGAGRTVQSVYFGGGTPSLLAPPALTGLLAHCRQAFDVGSDAEITLEANPETVTYDRSRGYLDAGVNRISMGVQSLDPEELAELGRSHTGERAIAAYEAIRRADCRNINVDLLYGLPGQTVDGWRDTLARVLDLGPDHLSAYALTPEPGTEIGTAVASGRLMLPVDDVIERQETVLYQAVAQAGMRRYEISNYARPGSTSRHNPLYWRCDDWLGFGASAHSHLAGWRWWNHFDPVDYIHGVGQHASVAGMETLPLDQRISEALSFGLRILEGVSRLRLTRRFGADPWILKAEGLARLVDLGLLEDDSQTIRLTPTGLALADSVAVSVF
jgi:oxygen-independent coproporphyrinogen-3 oxidase